MQPSIFNIPNFISVFRVFVAFWSFWYFLQSGNKIAFFLITVFVIVGDALDGIIARKLNQCTEFGAKLDIYCDRIVELSYWLFFGWIGLIHIWVFWFFLGRGLLVDWLSRKDVKPLGDSFLRSSRFMRGAYGFLKLLSFVMIILCPYYTFMGLNLTHLVVYLTVLICFLRAVPVVQDHFGQG